jgi:hypothetical protein
VAAGNNVTMMFEPISTPTNATAAMWGMVFVADTDGESLILGGTTDALSNSATEYNVVAGQGMVWGATENYTLLNACTLKKLYVELSASPRGNNDNDSYTFTIRIDTGNTTITTLIKDGGTGNKVGNDTTHTYDAANIASLKIQCVPSSSPAVVDAYWGLVCYIANLPIDKSLADSGSGADAQTIQATPALSDSGSGVDIISALASALAINDLGSGVDAISVLEALIAIAEAGAGEDLMSVVQTVAVAIAESGTGADVLEVLTDVLKSLEDSGGGADALLLAVALALADSGTGAQAVTILAEVFLVVE